MSNTPKNHISFYVFWSYRSNFGCKMGKFKCAVVELNKFNKSLMIKKTDWSCSLFDLVPRPEHWTLEQKSLRLFMGHMEKAVLKYIVLRQRTCTILLWEIKRSRYMCEVDFWSVIYEPLLIIRRLSGDQCLCLSHSTDGDKHKAFCS